jgi:hypothetical protein
MMDTGSFSLTCVIRAIAMSADRLGLERNSLMLSPLWNLSLIAWSMMVSLAVM